MYNYIVDYKVSLFPSKSVAHQSKNKNRGKVIIYASTLWKASKNSFELFAETLVFFTLLERICLERSFQKFRMRNRCKPYKTYPCKMEYITMKLYKMIRQNGSISQK